MRRDVSRPYCSGTVNTHYAELAAINPFQKVQNSTKGNATSLPSEPEMKQPEPASTDLEHGDDRTQTLSLFREHEASETNTATKVGQKEEEFLDFEALQALR